MITAAPNVGIMGFLLGMTRGLGMWVRGMDQGVRGLVLAGDTRRMIEKIVRSGECRIGRRRVVVYDV